MLADADGTAYASLRKRPVDRAERYELGKGLRERVPASRWGSRRRRRAARSAAQRIVDSRRGQGRAARPGARGPDDGVAVQFPARYRRRDGRRGRSGAPARPPASPSSAATPTWATSASTPRLERDLVIDLNDFDEAHPAATRSVDLRRLVASVVVAGRGNGAKRGTLRRRGADVRGGLPRGGPVPRRPAADVAFPRPPSTSTPGCESPEPLRHEISRAARARPPAHERPSAAPFHEGGEGPPSDRRGTALTTRVSDGEAEMIGDAGRTCTPSPRTGAGFWAATRSSTSRTRSSASGGRPGLRAYVVLLERRIRRTTWCSCSSNRRVGRCWRVTCTVRRRGTPTRGSGWSRYGQASAGR